MIPLVPISEILSVLLASNAGQAGLCITWSETLKSGFPATRLNGIKEPRLGKR